MRCFLFSTNGGVRKANALRAAWRSSSQTYRNTRQPRYTLSNSLSPTSATKARLSSAFSSFFDPRCQWNAPQDGQREIVMKLMPESVTWANRIMVLLFGTRLGRLIVLFTCAVFIFHDFL